MSMAMSMASMRTVGWYSTDPASPVSNNVVMEVLHNDRSGSQRDNRRQGRRHPRPGRRAAPCHAVGVGVRSRSPVLPTQNPQWERLALRPPTTGVPAIQARLAVGVDPEGARQASTPS